jgi:hypothetical protein
VREPEWKTYRDSWWDIGNRSRRGQGGPVGGPALVQRPHPRVAGAWTHRAAAQAHGGVDRLIILLFADLVTASTVVRLGLPMSIDGRRLMSATQFTLGFPTVGLTAGAAHAMFEYAMVPLSDSSCLQTSRTARGSSPHSWRGSLSLGSAERSSSNARRVAQRGLDGDGACRTTISVEPRMGPFAKLQTAAVSWRGPLAQPGDR